MQPLGGPQLDLSAQVALVRAKTRPWKSIIALVVAIAAAGTSGWAQSYFHHFFDGTAPTYQVIAAGTAVAFAVFGSIATVGLSGKVGSLLGPVAGVSHAAVVRYALLLIGAIIVLVVTLVLFGVQVGQLLLGGALTTVFVSIAAQQALGNVFSGLVLLIARPFNVGDAIRLRAGALSGEIDGTVTEIGITYLRLSTVNGIVSVPNSQVLNAAVGPLPPGDYPAPPPVAPPQVWPAPPAGPAAPAPADPATAAQLAVAAAQAAVTAAQAAVTPAPPVAAAPGPAPAPPAGPPDGGSAGPVGPDDGAGGGHQPNASGEQ
jgi:hypothetical protein